MNLTRIAAVMQKSWYNSLRDVFRIFDIFWWPAFELFIWGLFSTYLASSANTGINIISLILGGVILWTFFDRASRDISISMIDELWNRNFVNLFSTPLTLGEYLVGVALVALVKLILSIIFMFYLANLLYGFQVTSLGFYLVPAAIGLTVFGWSLSLFVQGFILRFGHTVEVFIWAVAVMAQPLSCVFYPLTALPGWAQKAAVFLPSTYLFENMRQSMNGHGINLTQIAVSYGLNLIYLTASILFLYGSLSAAKKKGNLIKNY